MPDRDATKSDDSAVGIQDSPSPEELTTLELIESLFKETIEADRDPNRPKRELKPVEAMLKFRRMTAPNFRL